MRRRKRDWETAVSVIIGNFMLSFLDGFFLMLAVGIVHAHIAPSVHAAGYSPCYAVALLLRAALGQPNMEEDDFA